MSVRHDFERNASAPPEEMPLPSYEEVVFGPKNHVGFHDYVLNGPRAEDEGRSLNFSEGGRQSPLEIDSEGKRNKFGVHVIYGVVLFCIIFTLTFIFRYQACRALHPSLKSEPCHVDSKFQICINERDVQTRKATKCAEDYQNLRPHYDGILRKKRSLELKIKELQKKVDSIAQENVNLKQRLSEFTDNSKSSNINTSQSPNNSNTLSTAERKPDYIKEILGPGSNFADMMTTLKKVLAPYNETLT